MRWAVSYQAAKGSAWIDLGVETRSSSDAWDYFTMIRRTTALPYYAAQVYQKGTTP